VKLGLQETTIKNVYIEIYLAQFTIRIEYTKQRHSENLYCLYVLRANVNILKNVLTEKNKPKTTNNQIEIYYGKGYETYRRKRNDKMEVGQGQL